jgi:hypothetical protein
MWFLIFLISTLVYSQIPTVGLQEQYDMVTVTGGTTLSDLSGNAKNGTLHGTTQSASQGTTFNGSSDYISIPNVIGQSNFTAMAFSIPSANGGFLWAENNNAGGGYAIGTNGGGINRILFDTGGNSIPYTLPANFGNETKTFHCYYLYRDGATGIAGVFDQDAKAAIDLGTARTVTPNAAAIGARVTSGTAANFWTGTLGYMLIWNRSLSKDEMLVAYNAVKATLLARGAYLPDARSDLNDGAGVWQRRGVVIAQTNEGGNVNEPTAMYDTNCQIVASPCFKLWYGSSGGIFYAESLDGTTNWTKHSGTVLAGVGRNYVYKSGSTYYLYGTTAITAIRVYTSSNGIAWTLANATGISLGSAGSWDDTELDNSVVTKIGATWYMVYEGLGTNSHSFQAGGATSSDGITWTKTQNFPLTGNGHGCSPGALYQDVSLNWWLWCWGAVKINGLDTNERWTSSTFGGVWNLSPAFPVFLAGPADESGQASDISMVEANGKTYVYYQSSDGGAPVTQTIKVRVANMPLAQVVLTQEGATQNVP